MHPRNYTFRLNIGRYIEDTLGVDRHHIFEKPAVSDAPS